MVEGRNKVRSAYYFGRVKESESIALAGAQKPDAMQPSHLPPGPVVKITSKPSHPQEFHPLSLPALGSRPNMANISMEDTNDPCIPIRMGV